MKGFLGVLAIHAAAVEIRHWITRTACTRMQEWWCPMQIAAPTAAPGDASEFVAEAFRSNKNPVRSTGPSACKPMSENTCIMHSCYAAPSTPQHKNACSNKNKS